MKIVSYTWFRTEYQLRPIEFYTRHWSYLFRLFPIIYPDFVMRWHVQDTQLDFFMSFIQDYPQDIQVVPFQCNHMSVGHLWRLAPCWDREAEYCFCADCDAIPHPIVRKCRDDFVASGFDGHVVRGCWDHSGQMMGGLCGFRCNAVSNLYESFEAFLADHEPVDKYQHSQWYIRSHIWDKLKLTMSHNHPHAQPFKEEKYAILMPNTPISLPGVDQALVDAICGSTITGGGGNYELIEKVLNGPEQCAFYDD